MYCDGMTVFSTKAFYEESIDLRTDFVIVEGLDETTGQRIKSWKDKGYQVFAGVGLSYGNYNDYLNGKWDEEKYALVKPALWQDDNGKFISLDHTIALGANGISLSDYYGSGNSSTTAPDSKIIAGDVNSDKLVNGVDLTLMRQNITKWQSTEDVLTASPQDTNGNGVFSVADIVLLTQYLLGKDVTLKSYTS